MRADGSGSCGLGEITLGEVRALKGSERRRHVTDAGVRGRPLVVLGGGPGQRRLPSGVHERPLVGVGGLAQRPLHWSRRFSSLLPPDPHSGTGSVLDLTKDPSERIFLKIKTSVSGVTQGKMSENTECLADVCALTHIC